MKILYDHQAFTIQKFGGISRYFTELMKQLSSAENLTYEISLKYSDNLYLRELNSANKLITLPEHFKGKSTLLNLINKPFSKKNLKQGAFNIFHPTYYDPYFIKYLGSHPFVLTIHDMTHELFPEKVHPYDRSSEYKKILVKKAAKIICVSQNTRKDLCRIFNVDETRTEVIYHGSSINKSEGKLNIKLPDKYILYVGSRIYYKNFNKFFLAVEPLLKQDKNLYLICGGGGKFSKRESKIFEEVNLQDQILYQTITDKILSQLYAGALVFVFPSLYEGFGIPIVEAFNCDCPVIASNVSSLPEVGGDAVYYIDPYDTLMIRESVLKFILDGQIRKEFIIRGKKRKTLFTWNKTAEQTKNLYYSI